MRLGLLAAARITTKAVVAPARLVPEVELAAVAARSLDRARESAADWGVPVAYGSYEELLADDSIDAVYIATPAALHEKWTLAALAAGKHVLCEKPLASNATEAREMVAAGDEAGLILMEAFHWRYHPYLDQIRSLVDSGVIGEARRAEGYFNLAEGRIPRGDIRWDLPLGGGALMDLGCYPVQWVRWLVGGEPTVLSAIAECPVPAVDGFLRAELSWPSGVTGAVECSMIAPADGNRIELIVLGSRGTLTATQPVAPQDGARLFVETAAGRTEHEVDTSTTTYYHQLVAFLNAVESGVPPITSGDDAIATMEVIDACYRAAGLEPRPSLVD
jgi:predicted dehydrogenase